MEVQAALGSDIVMAFDECAPGKASYEDARKSMELTGRWAQRSRARFDVLQQESVDVGQVENRLESLRRTEDEGHISSGRCDAAADAAMAGLPGELSGTQALFGIVQGAAHLDLRRESLQRTVETGFDGYAIGGLSVGEEKSVMWEVVGEVATLMPADRAWRMRSHTTRK